MISQILGVVMLIYLGVAIFFVMAELWSRPGLRMGAGFFCGSAWRCRPGPSSGAGSLVPAGRRPFSRRRLSGQAELIIIQAPLSNRYESLVFFAWCLPAVGLIAFRNNLQGWLGAVVAMLACLLLAYASFGVDADIQPLMPALKSNWLLIHVMTAFLGYAAFAVAFGAALLYLVQEKRPRPSLPAPPLLDRLIYRATMLGFLLLTFGILTGAVWAETAWGRYWSWDPKETWSLITWLIYAALLHARLLKGLAGPAHRLAGGARVPGGDLHLSRGQLPPHRLHAYLT